MPSPLGSSAARPIVVHDYALVGSTPEPPEELLGRGRLAAARDERWRNVHTIRVEARFSVKSHYQFNEHAPKAMKATKPALIAEWDVSPSAEEMLSLVDLEEFENTDLESLFESRKRSASPEDDDLDEPAYKRRKYDESSLRDVIPAPHILPSLPNLPIRQYNGPMNLRATPTPIPPHKLPLPPTSPYTRRSWVIPIRGVSPWRRFGLTTAQVLFDSSKTKPSKLPSPPAPDSNEITWTPSALRSLWAFLRDMRKKNQLGPIGLSYNVAATTGSGYSQEDYAYGQPQTVETSTAPSLAASMFEGAMRLHQIDHIKVYHDAMNSMGVRNVLYAWAYLPPDGGEKIRMLKGARFVLLDERSSGIIIL
uniref:Uncharacterized protein n=1 Tax=Mycena chlorophos TaxID=658473 RepID=A0ABQ0LKN1_MYCCL|nr:predicted protein [Mycena chlorophos]